MREEKKLTKEDACRLKEGLQSRIKELKSLLASYKADCLTCYINHSYFDNCPNYEEAALIEIELGELYEQRTSIERELYELRRCCGE